MSCALFLRSRREKESVWLSQELHSFVSLPSNSGRKRTKPKPSLRPSVEEYVLTDILVSAVTIVLLKWYCSLCLGPEHVGLDAEVHSQWGETAPQPYYDVVSLQHCKYRDGKNMSAKSPTNDLITDAQVLAQTGEMWRTRYRDFFKTTNSTGVIPKAAMK